ncbi:hypothetical protein [Microbacterium enclense]|uniref:Replicative helicase inhibitor G39P N-terminal domain-containing protein n=1 Tax=Microbacterium enclense TaxID=993073 RepID=A0A1G6NT33_9MICO|nr:hypothetical protein [Microbacterium enclense]KSU52872.1 hypothetical protein AS029_12750 [Microbacterium enclense]SDC70524.1 hypothetical protein SAMN05216418_2829 [Microbacterium enclense]
MNTQEAAKLLAVAAGFDNRRPDDLATAAWRELLGDFTYEQCRAAIVAHYRDPATRHQYLTAAHVLDRVEANARTKTADVETDVRSAKARGIVPADWPRRQPLDPEAAYRLQAARERDRQESIRHTTGAIEAGA